LEIPDEKGNYPCHLAAISGNLEIFEYLIDLNIDMSRKNNEGLEPIHFLAMHDHLELLNRLVELAQVDINASGECGSTPIHYCCIHDSVRCLETLIAHGADIYKANNHKTYPIHAALENVSRKCIEVLFAEEERKQRGNEQPTPKLLLVVNENEKPGRGSRRWSFRRSSISPSKEMPQMVTMVNHINLVDCEGDTPLHTAVRSGDLEQVKLCLHHGANIMAIQNDQETPVHYACSKSDLECVKLMLEARPNQIELCLSMVNRSGYTPLHIATLYDHVPLLEYLVEQGAPIDATDSTGLTALLLGAKKGSYRSCCRLIDLGANVSSSDANERNIVHLMMLHYQSGIQGMMRIFEMSLVSQDLVFRKDSSGCTPLHYAAEHGRHCMVRCLLSLGVTILDRNAEGDTPMHLAAQRGRNKVVQYLLESPEGIRALYQEDVFGQNPLHRAVTQGHVHVTEMLLEKGGIFRKCHAGNSPLHLAARYGQLEICQVLLKLSPAMLDQVNFEGLTALHFAATNDCSEVVDFLLTSGAQIVPSNDGVYFVTDALNRRHYNTLKAIIMHQRWPEIWNQFDGTTHCVLDGLIREIPSLYAVTYDFSVLQREKDIDERIKDPLHRVSEETIASRVHRFRIFGWVLFSVITVHILLKLFQLKQQRLEYFHDWSNTLELLLLGLANALFVDAALGGKMPNRKIVGAFLMLLSWFNFMMQISRVKYLGIFIVMFLQVFTTVIQCLLVFSIVVIGFGFVFHVLLREPDYRLRRQLLSNLYDNISHHTKTWIPSREFQLSEREQFDYLGISIFKTIMMMFGEYEHSRTLIYPLFGSTEEATIGAALVFIFYIAFLLLVPIILMNLLIGLAVGDIDEVRKTACQKLTIQQIYWLADLELKFPRKLRHKIFKSSVSWVECQMKHNSRVHHSHKCEPQLAENPVEKRFVDSSAFVLLTRAFVLEIEMAMIITRCFDICRSVTRQQRKLQQKHTV
ncbi:transient receptor potential cation channel subfamily A member 1, partial [Clonorchis sinensis]